LFVLLLLLAGVSDYAFSQPEVTLVLAGFRHADRNPGNFLKDDPNKGKWGLEGESQLTDIGKKEAYGLGKVLRERYGKLVTDQWSPDIFSATSSSAERCQMTTQLAMAGLFPPKDYAIWNQNLLWQPVPYKIDDDMLRAYNIKCPNSDKAWKPANEGLDPHGKALLENNKELIKFVSEKTGWKPDLSRMADVADNLNSMHERKLEFPSWVTKDNPFHKNIYEDIEKFAEATQIGCAETKFCAKMMSGLWWNDVLNRIKKKHEDKKNKQTMQLYGTHNEIVSSFMEVVGVKRPHGTPYNGAAILEYSDAPTQQVRVLLSDPVKGKPEERTTTPVTEICGKEWCSLQEIIDKVKDSLINDMNFACGLPACPRP